MTATIQRWGSGSAVKLPEFILEKSTLNENDQVELTAAEDMIIIKKVTGRRRAKKSLEERFKDYTGDYKCFEWDTGHPVGREVW